MNYVPHGQLGLDLTCVRNDLDALAKFGFAVEYHPYLGAAYRGPAERLCPDQIEHGLATERIGRRMAVWNRVTSTNDLAARAGMSSSNDGLVILAEEQTAGRGRRGRQWTAPACSSILMSVVLFPPPPLASSRVGVRFCLVDRTGRGGDRRSGYRLDRPRCENQVAQRCTRRRAQDRRHPGRARVELARPEGMKGQHHAGTSGGWGAVIGIGLNVNLNARCFPTEMCRMCHVDADRSRRRSA